ncbi:MAG: ferritin-like domain-containing protein, partial [Acidobacteria bacterium]|nr:ferritin-like domain-containing protein [Candidatus Sulfomarinibacter sp. MAG AM1]
MNTEYDAITDVLRKAFQVEVDGFTFYSMTAERVTKPAVRKLFERLARDETEHQAYIRAVMRRYEEHG